MSPKYLHSPGSRDSCLPAFVEMRPILRTINLVIKQAVHRLCALEYAFMQPSPGTA